MSKQLTVNSQQLTVSEIRSWVSRNKIELLILGLILMVGALMRLYRISEYMTFLGDEGRDVIIVRRLLVEHHPPLIGPGTSIGNMYLGPLYYYMMAPALFLANFSPVGPAVMIALLGVATIFLVWFVAREWFPSFNSINLGALVAAGLYAISPTVIIYSRSSWNPNIMPFFALLSIYSIWRIYQKHEWKWLPVLGISYAFVLQSHYLGLLLAPVLFLFWLLTLKDLRLIEHWSLDIGHFAKYSLLGFGVFAILMSPLVIFDARHGWHNFAAIKEFFTARQSTVSFRPWNSIPNLYPIFENVNTRLLAGRNEMVGKAMTIGMVMMAIWLAWLIMKKGLTIQLSNHSAVAILFSWIGFALIGLGLYRQQIYDHYFGFFFPAPFLLVGGLASQVSSIKYQVSKIALFIVLSSLFIVNLQNSPLRYPPNMQLKRSQIVAKKILEEAGGKPFNLAVLAERNYEDGYKYFLLLWKEPVVDIDAQLPSSVADQLFVVCEMPKEKCDPTHSPKAEVANFGWSKIENQWDTGGITLYKLVHAK